MIRFENVSTLYASRRTPRAGPDQRGHERGEFVLLVEARPDKLSLRNLALPQERATTGQIHALGRELTQVWRWKVTHLRQIGTALKDLPLKRLPRELSGEQQRGDRPRWSPAPSPPRRRQLDRDPRSLHEGVR
ncbi:hypothetical protein GCM10022262_40640 [Georgenia daeguensis]|uniref:Uncharacterized protein n=1 Tax=Georgenia daeguensis TaxID=908355 RepID=A0ABP6UMT6_9MICO